MTTGSSGPSDGVATDASTDDGPSEAWRERVVRRSLESATRRSLDRSHAFITAAIELLRDSGNSFTVQDVCDEAGFSMRLFYRYFDGKDDLLVAVLEEVIEEAVEGYRHRFEQIEDPLERLSVYLRQSAMPRNDSMSVALVRYVIELGRTRPEQLASAHRPHVALITELIDDAVRAGLLPPGDTAVRAYCVLSIRTTYNHSQLLGNEIGLPMPTPEELERFCMRALGADHPEPAAG